jgi:hypothetical protein
MRTLERANAVLKEEIETLQTRHAAAMLHNQGVVDENTRLNGLVCASYGALTPDGCDLPPSGIYSMPDKIREVLKANAALRAEVVEAHRNTDLALDGAKQLSAKLGKSEQRAERAEKYGQILENYLDYVGLQQAKHEMATWEARAATGGPKP